MAFGSRAPFPWPPRAGKRGSASNGGFVGSCPRCLWRGIDILPVGLCLLLLAPPAKFHISPNHDLQCGIDDVIRRALNEGRVLLNCNCDWPLQFVFAPNHFRRSINDRHDFSFLSSSWLYRTRAKHMVNRESSCSLGWSDRHGSRGNEVGSLQPIPRVCPRPNGSSRHAQPLCSQQLRGTPGVTRTVTGRVTCVFHAPVTAAKDLRHW